MNGARFRLAVSVVALVVGACGGGPPSFEVPAVDDHGWTLDGPRECRSRKGRYEIRWRPEPDPPPFNEPFELVTDVSYAATGDPVESGTSVNVHATMPAHNHGQVRVPVTERVGPGRYRTTNFLLHMQGEWQFSLRIVEGEGHDIVHFMTRLH